MNEWLDECNVKRNVVDILARDCKAKSEPKKDSEDGILSEVDITELQAALESVRKHYEKRGSGLLGGIKSLFRK